MGQSRREEDIAWALLLIFWLGGWQMGGKLTLVLDSVGIPFW